MSSSIKTLLIRLFEIGNFKFFSFKGKLLFFDSNFHFQGMPLAGLTIGLKCGCSFSGGYVSLIKIFFMKF